MDTRRKTLRRRGSSWDRRIPRELVRDCKAQGSVRYTMF